MSTDRPQEGHSTMHHTRRRLLKSMFILGAIGTVGGANQAVGAAEDPAYTIELTHLPERDCSDSPTVTVDPPTVTIQGCVIGKNGCHEPSLSDHELIDGHLQVTIESAEQRDDNQACTQVIAHNSYEVTVTFDNKSMTPSKNEVVVQHHDYYTNAQGVVTTDGMLTMIADWRKDAIETQRLIKGISAWRDQTAITYRFS